MYNVFITAWRAEKPLNENLAAMARLMRSIPTLDSVDTSLCMGKYKGEYEQCLCIHGMMGYEFYLSLAQDFEQECIMLVDAATHDARLVFCDESLPDVPLGKLVQVFAKEALAQDAFSYDGGHYYVCKSESN